MWASLNDAIERSKITTERVARRFGKDEEGSLIIFTLFLLVIVLLVAGTAIDAMRHETRRVALQNTLDSAILAAASLNQTIDAETLIKNHVSKAGMDPNAVVVAGNDTFASGSGALTSRNVTVTADVGTPTMFMSMMGIDRLESDMGSAAEEAIMNIEISLIVDISGSMGSNQRMTNLKVAAKDFVDHVLSVGPNAQRTSISIIPYNATVVAGQDLLDRLNADGETIVIDPVPVYPAGYVPMPSFQTEHDFSSCIRFRDNDFNSREISPTTALERVAHYRRNGMSYSQPNPDTHRWCNEKRSEILVHETNIGVLQSHIEGLNTGGWTGIDNGMKWGVALLDPAFQPVITGMVNDNELPVKLAGRPGAYDPDATKKIIVLMTDGANTLQRDLKDDYKNGPTRIWRAESRSKDELDGSGNVVNNYEWYDAYFVEMPNNPPEQRWYVPGSPNTTSDDFFVADPMTVIPNDPDGDEDELRQQDYITLYNRFAARDLASFFFQHSGDTAAYNAHWNAETTHDANGQIDDRLQDICDAANEKINGEPRMEVYAIGFEAPTGGQNAMKNCATVPGNYFDVNGTEISAAFNAIAGQITLLRLTN